ncbi:MAG: ATP-binding protein [Nitrososphaera sp.]|uniref:ATP-binding protein n=1 Tax=Nitrososphaera sp. TaxID=1971748 RepID=UPI003D6EE795
MAVPHMGNNNGQDVETLSGCISSCGMTAEGWYKNIYDNSPNLYRTINTDGIILDCNWAYVKTLGYSNKEELVGTSIFDCTAEQSLDHMRKTFEAWKKSGHVQNREIWLRRKDGSAFPALLSASSVYDKAGALVVSNTVITDVTEISNARQALEQANSELRSIERSKDEFIAMISHELKTPIVPMRLYTDTFIEGGMASLNEKQVKAIKSFARNLDKLESLVGDVLDAYKLDMGNLKFSREDAPVDSLINDIVEELKPYTLDKKIQLDADIRTAGTVHCDQKRIGQVMANLVKNSVDFLPAQGGRIAIRAEGYGESFVVVTVEDNGPGIPADKADGLFKKFYYVDTSATRKHGGSGLGLSICKGIVEAHGGTIWLDKSYDKGAAIKFTLPREGPA